MFLQREIFAKNDLYTQVRARLTTHSPTYCKQILIFFLLTLLLTKKMVNAAATQPQSCVYTWLGRLLSTPTNSKSTERLGVFIDSLTSP